MKKNLLLIVVTLMIVPQVTFASWWNPFTWSIFSSVFHSKNQTQVVNTVTQLQSPPIVATEATTSSPISTTTTLTSESDAILCNGQYYKKCPIEQLLVCPTDATVDAYCSTPKVPKTLTAPTGEVKVKSAFSPSTNEADVKRKSIENATILAAQQSAQKATEDAANLTARQAAQKAAEDRAKTEAQLAAQKATQDATALAAQQAAQRAAQDATNLATQQAEQEATRIKQDKLNAINKQIADLNTKYAQDIYDANHICCITTAVNNAKINGINTKYTNDYNILVAQYQTVLYSN